MDKCLLNHCAVHYKVTVIFKIYPSSHKSNNILNKKLLGEQIDLQNQLLNSPFQTKKNISPYLEKTSLSRRI